MQKNRLLKLSLLLVLIFLVGCHETFIKSDNVEKVDAIASPTPVDSDAVVKDITISPPSGTAAECAFLEKTEGFNFCGFDDEISGMKKFSCVQTFQQSRAPFAKVIVTAMNYSHPLIQEADVSKSIVDKFEYDKKLDVGKAFLEISNAYVSDKTDDQRKVEFFRGNYLIRVTEIPPQGCFNFDDLVKKLVVKAEERVK